MEFIDLKTQYKRIEIEVQTAINKVLAHGKYIMGPEVLELEQSLAEYAGVEHCISCANGTDALQMVLMAWGIGHGDAVFVPSFTFMSTAEVVRLVGAVPIFVDCKMDTYNMDPDNLEEAVNTVVHRGELIPKAIIPVDLFGQLACYEAIMPVAEKYSLLVLEDAAQSFGASYNGKMAGSFGHAATTSFFPAKPLGCYGDGGAIFTNDADLAALLKSIRVHGQGTDKYDNIRIGLNARLDTLQAVVLQAKLEIFPDEMEKRQRVATDYANILDERLVLPYVPTSHMSAWAQYSVLAKDTMHRSRVMEALKAEGIPSMIYYQKPLHMQEAFADMSHHQTIACQVSEEVASRIFSLPMHPYLLKTEIERIADVINTVEV